MSKHTPRAVLKDRLATLPKRNCSCGHFAVRAGDYYEGRGDLVCLQCYRDREAERQRSYRNGTAATGLTKPRRVREARDPIDDHEVQAALGVLRDHRAQRRKLAQGYVYCIGEVGRWDAVKVGYSVKPAARVAELQTGNPRSLVLLAAFEGTEADERRLHRKFLKHNILLEWFRPTAALLSEFGLEMPAAGGAGSDERSATTNA